MAKKLSLVGKKFTRLLVLEDAPSLLCKSGQIQSRSLCLCDCGTTKIIRNGDLNHGTVRSCGCFRVDSSRSRATTHGYTSYGDKSSEYQTWEQIKRKCHSPTHERYKDYGGRGITVCKRWRESFECFIADMGQRPKGMSIERKDNNAGYCPENCCWATRTQQARNQRSNRIVTLRGVTGCFAFICEHFGLNQNTVRARLHHGWTLDRALSHPVKPRKRSGGKFQAERGARGPRQGDV
jgi:hypothetical protein